jgi:hypothetical protein
MTRFYHARWTIEQVNRTMKTEGSRIEAVCVAEGGPVKNLVDATPRPRAGDVKGHASWLETRTDGMTGQQRNDDSAGAIGFRGHEPGILVGTRRAMTLPLTTVGSPDGVESAMIVA